MDAPSGSRGLVWKRLALVAVTVAALAVVVRRVDGRAFVSALLRMDPGWFALGVILYGLALGMAAWRWHLSLRATRCRVNLSASARLYCIGHYFCLIMFGGAPGDVAKSALYGRWFGYSFTEVFASVLLDRLLGFAGLVLFWVVASGAAMLNGDFAQAVEIRLPGRWMVVAAPIGVLLAGLFIWLERKRDGPGLRMLRSLRGGGSELARRPGLAAGGVLLGFLVQASLAGVLACTLRAISEPPLPWGKLCWTLPVISALGSLPVTVAGLGVREGAAIVLLGLYGVPPADAAAAALLTLGTKLLWTGVGGGLLWREERCRARQGSAPAPRTISVVIPTLNERDQIEQTIARARAVAEVAEILVVDGGSEDGTQQVVTALGCRLLSAPRGRGKQLRVGAGASVGDVVLLLHADTWLPPGAGGAVLDCLRDPVVVAGGFWKEFRQTPWLLWGSKFKCGVRLYLGRRVLGDQALFVRRRALEAVGGVPDLELMEEFELCRRLRAVGRLALADNTVSTSARRFEKLGVLRTYWRMWRVTTLYRLGTPAAELLRRYDGEGPGVGREEKH